MIILQPFFALLCGTAEFTVLERFRVNILMLQYLYYCWLCPDLIRQTRETQVNVLIGRLNARTSGGSVQTRDCEIQFCKYRKRTEQEYSHRIEDSGTYHRNRQLAWPEPRQENFALPLPF